MPDQNENATDMELRVKLPDPEEIARVGKALLNYSDAEQKLGRAASNAAGPYERLAQARERLNRASVEGDVKSARYRDLLYQRDQAEARIRRINAPAPEKQEKPEKIAKPPKLPKPPKPEIPDYMRRRGPNERLSRARANLELAQQNGASPDKIADLQYELGNAQKHVDKINKPEPDFMKRLGTALYSSRFGGGGGGGGGLGGLMPLLGKSIDVVGGAGAGAELLANPYTAAALAAYKVAESLYKVSAEAAHLGAEFSAIRNQTGANSREAGQLSVFSKATGVDFAGLSGQLNSKITDDPFARGMAARFGATNIPGPYGKVDQAGNLLKVIEGLRKITDDQERIRTARALGVEGALPLTQVSGDMFGRLKGDAANRSKIMDPGFEKQSAEFNAAAGRVTVGWENMIAALGKNLFPIMIPLLNGIADTEEMIAAFANGDLKGALKFGAKAVMDFEGTRFEVLKRTSLPGQAYDLAQKSGMFRLKGTPKDEATGSSDADSGDPHLKANTYATERLTMALIALTKQMIGGGERARSAMPGSLTGPALDRAIEMNALHFGDL